MYDKINLSKKLRKLKQFHEIHTLFENSSTQEIAEAVANHDTLRHLHYASTMII